jgi:carboxypeptidase family protein
MAGVERIECSIIRSNSDILHEIRRGTVSFGHWLRRCAVLAIATSVTSAAYAQSGVTTGGLKGTVTDATGGVLPGALVTAVFTDTNLSTTGRADAAGRYTLAGLVPGTYALTAAAAGLVAARAPNVLVTIGRDTLVDFTLSTIEAINQGVLVAARAPLDDPARHVVGTTVARLEIEDLPNNIRDPMSFAFLAPGVTTDRTPQQGSSATSGLTFAGQRARSNNVLADGLDNNDSAVGGVRSVLPQEAVGEFQVLTSSYSAELGKASGGVVSIITRHGTNAHTGSAFLLMRDDTLNAKNYFERFNPAGDSLDRRRAPYGQQQYGASIGGPLRRDRTFYFAAFEGLDIQTNNFVTIDDTTPVTVLGRPVGTAADLLGGAGFPVATGHVPYNIGSKKLFAKVDQNLGAGTLSLHVNWATDFNENSEPWGGEAARSRGGALDARDLTVATVHSLPLGQRGLNEFRMQMVYRDQTVFPLDPSCSGTCDRDDEGGPTLELAGVASVGRQRFSPQPRKTARYQVVDAFSIAHRDGLLKFGGDYNAIDHLSGSLPLHFGGRYIFAPLPAIPGLLPTPVSAIQAFALGLPAAYVQGYGNPASTYVVHDLSLFAQEELRLGNVVIRAGARYQTQIWPAIRYAVNGLEPYTFPSNNNVAPRLAAAWTAHPRTSVHAAWGRFYDNHLTSLPGVTDIVDGTSSGVRTLVLRFPGSIAAWNAPGHRLPEAAVGAFPSLAITVAPNLHTPYSDQTTVGLTQELASALEFSADVIHVRGRDQVGTLDYNPLIPELGLDRRPGDLVAGGLPIPGSSASLLQYTSYGRTWYDGLAISLHQRLTRAAQWRAIYTLSKAEDNSTDYQNAFLPQNTGKGRDPRNPNGLPVGFEPIADKGPSLQDQRHRFVASGVWLAPAEFRVSGIVTIASGRPYNILAGADLNGDGNGGAFPPDRARRVPGDPSSSVSRNRGILPMYTNTDLRVSRDFVHRGWRLEATIEAFNLFNRTNFTDVNNIFGTGAYPRQPLPTFGRFEVAAPPRQVQVGLTLRR